LELQPESKRYSSTLEKKKEKPVFLSQLTPASVASGETARLTVRVSGFPKPTVKWSSNCVIVADPDGSGFIRIQAVKQADSGLYTCKASNQLGEASCSAQLVVVKE
uniref:Ig-like domain-containing protein n=1 Tax=Salarias fasciatus TaxID=181472 RepID=A0A672I7Z7_SALFA